MKNVKALLPAAGILLLATGAGIAFYPNPQVAHAGERSQAEALVSLAAKQVCSCLHVAGRELDSCRDDSTLDMRGISYTDQNNMTRAVSHDGRASAQAKFTPGLGCTLVKP
nr:hypothetical protein [uncultured Hyphomonas sp.]